MGRVQRERFESSVSEHVVHIDLDEGVFRHVRFKKSDSISMSFSLTTTPGRLVYAGDMGTFVFERLYDMFQFFRPGSPETRPNFSYWHAKLIAVDSRDGDREHCENLFRQNLESYLHDDLDISKEDSELVREFIEEAVSMFDEKFPHHAYEAVRQFELFFFDFWEMDDQVFTYRFEWACYAIQWGILQYDAAIAQPTTP